MKNAGQDKYRMEMTEWFSKERLPATGLEQQELLQDKIDMHLAYAELHKRRWERFEGINISDLSKRLGSWWSGDQQRRSGAKVSANGRLNLLPY
jgi:hypothetical protein